MPDETPPNIPIDETPPTYEDIAADESVDPGIREHAERLSSASGEIAKIAVEETDSLPRTENKKRPKQKSSPKKQKKHLGNPTGMNADRERQARKIDRMIQLTGLDESLKTEESRIEFIDSLTPMDFVQLLREMNGVLLNIPSSERGLTEAIQVSVEPGTRKILEVHPASEDKELLLKEVLEKAQGMIDIEDKSMILAVGVNAVHPFPEGNGRIARSIYYLLMKGYRYGDEELRALMGKSGEKIISPDPNLIRPGIMGNFELDMGTHMYDPKTNSLIPKISPIIVDKRFGTFRAKSSELASTLRYQEVSLILSQEDFGCIVPFLALLSDRSGTAYKSLIEDKNKLFFGIDLFLTKASQEELDYFYEIYRDVKNAYISILLSQLSLGKDSDQILWPNHDCVIEKWPMAEIMKAHLSGKL